MRLSLVESIQTGNLARVRELVCVGVDLREVDAVDEGHPEIAEFFLAHGADFNPSDYMDETGAVLNVTSDLIDMARKNRAKKNLNDDLTDCQ